MVSILASVHLLFSAIVVPGVSAAVAPPPSPVVTPATQLLKFDRATERFSITHTAQQLLPTLPGPFFVVTIHGKPRHGPTSTLLTLLVKEWFRDTEHEAQANRFRFSRSDAGMDPHGQWFAAIRWEERDGLDRRFIGTVLIVDSEGTTADTSTNFLGIYDAKLFSIARMASHELALRSSDVVPLPIVQKLADAAFAKLPANLRTHVNNTHTMVLQDSSKDSPQNRAALLSQCGSGLRDLLTNNDPEDVFCFAAPLNVPADDRIDGQNELEYEYPRQFSKQYLGTLDRWVRRLKGSMAEQFGERRFDGTGRELLDWLQVIVDVPNAAIGEGKDAVYPTPARLAQLVTERSAAVSAVDRAARDRRDSIELAELRVKYAQCLDKLSAFKADEEWRGRHNGFE